MSFEARPILHLRRNDALLLEMFGLVGHIHALNDTCVLRAPFLEESNCPEAPGVVTFWYCGSPTIVQVDL